MKYLFVFLFLCTSATAFSQTLQYSQVKLITTTETVPGGKVWKVESVMASSNLATTAGTDSQNHSVRIVVNGTTVHIKAINTWVGSSSGSNANPRPYGVTTIDVTDLPIWLPAGTTLEAGTNAAYISVIEFNEAP